MSVLVVGDILIERLLVAGDGHETYSQHVAQKAAESPLPSFCRVGGAALTVSLLGAQAAYDSKSLQGVASLWDQKGGQKAADGRSIARQIFGMRRMPLLSPDDRAKTYRVERMMAFDYLPFSGPSFESQLSTHSRAKFDTVLIEDFGLGGYTRRESVFAAADAIDAPLIVKSSRPATWLKSAAEAKSVSPDRPAVVLGSIDTFFVDKGFSLRSWDAVVRDVYDVLHEYRKSPGWRLVLACRHEGVLMAYPENNEVHVALAWDRAFPLGGLARLGWVPGSQNVLAASLARTKLRAAPTAVWSDVLESWRCARRVSFRGHGVKESELEDIGDGKGVPEWVSAAMDSDVEKRVNDFKQRISRLKEPDKDWSMFHSEFNDLDRAARRQLAYSLVSRGAQALTSPTEPTDGDLADGAAHGFAERIPAHRIGQLVMFEDQETDALTRLVELIRDYSDRREPARPLSIAVFGRPGSGKSFAVKEILSHLKIPAETLSFNLSQFGGPDDLRQALQSIQTVGLRRKLPVVFWDEFDCEGMKWLRYFLAPMQDGEFLNNGERHMIGRAIFVFAGGVAEIGSAFFKHEKHKVDDPAHAKAREQKVPDFASRVKVVYDVPPLDLEGPSKTGSVSGKAGAEYAKVLRRALVVRLNIRRHAPHLRKVSKRVLHRLLFDPLYRTARDLENAIEAATVGAVDTFGESLLPRPVWGQTSELDDEELRGVDTGAIPLFDDTDR